MRSAERVREEISEALKHTILFYNSFIILRGLIHDQLCRSNVLNICSFPNELDLSVPERGWEQPNIWD